MLRRDDVEAEQPLQTALQRSSVDVVRYFVTEAGINMGSCRWPVCARVSVRVSLFC
jgi:hypothetical protein